MRKIIAVLGDAFIGDDKAKFDLAFATGKAIIDNGYRLQCGGMGGVMEAACMGAKSSEKYVDGDIIAIVPGFDTNNHNAYIDIPIPTGLDIYRNLIVANASAVIAIGGGAGTLSEIASAWTMMRLVVAYDCVEGWAKKLAGTRLDYRIRYENIPDDRIYAVSNPDEALKIINERMELYNGSHKGIRYSR